MPSTKRNLILLISIILGFSLAFWLRQLHQPQLPALPETIIVGTTADYPPFAFKQKDSADNEQIVGFDIDVITEAVKRLNKTMALKDTPFELLIPQAQMGTIHVIAAGFTKTPEREQQVLFTPSYAPATPLIVVFLKDKNFKKLENLTDKRIVVNAGYTADLYISKLQHVALEHSTVDHLPSPEDAMYALKNGLADAYVVSGNTTQMLTEDFSSFVIPETNEQNALAISKLYPELAQQLSKIVNEMIADGTIEQFKQKWHVQ